MSIEDNKKIVRLYQEIYYSDNLERLTKVVSEDLLTPNIMPGILHGMEGAKAAHRIMLAGFPDYQTIIEDIVAEGDKVCARIKMTGTHSGEFMGIPATMKRITFTGMYIVKLPTGRSLSIGEKRMG